MIRVLVADDSALMRKRISEILNSDRDIRVVDTAKTGAEAIKKTVQLKPDVITLDIHLPEIDGLTALGYIMNEVPTPVIIVSGSVHPASQQALKAMELGAVAVIAKPEGQISLNIREIDRQLIDKVKTASTVDIKRIRAIFNKISRRPPPSAALPAVAKPLNAIVAIGASTGGPKALKEVLPYFSAEIPAAFLVVQHMPANFTRSMSERLNWMTKLSVKEAADMDLIQPGWAYIAPGDHHMVVKTIDGSPVIRLTRDPPVCCVRPSATVMMSSAAEVFGPRVIGVLLTGMGSDGVEGMKAIKFSGGRTMAEDESTCVVFGMPKMAIKEGVVDKVVPLHHVGIEIMKLIQNRDRAR